MTYSFFDTPKREDVEKKIQTARDALLIISQQDRELFEQLLSARIMDFDTELTSFDGDKAQCDRVIEQYNRFATTLVRCIHKPANHAAIVNSYHNSINYYPVGIKAIEKPNPLHQKLAYGAVVLGVSLLLAAIPAFLINPILGVALIAAAITCLTPSALYLLTPESKDMTAKKAQEAALFENCANLLITHAALENWENCPQEPTAHCQPG